MTLALLAGKETALPDRLAAFLELEDFPGLGNCLLEILLRPGQQETPDAASLDLVVRAPQWVARQFGIPEALTYPCPYREKHIAHSDRGDWGKDAFVFLVILAYVLGATRENSPPPHDELVPYYQKTAAEQHRLIEKVARAYQSRAKPPPPPKPAVTHEQVAAILHNPEEDAESKLQALAALLAGPAPAPANRLRDSAGIA